MKNERKYGTTIGHMENRKIIISFYLVSSIVGWFLTRSLVQYLFVTLYQVRRIPGIATVREALPVAVGAIIFLVLFRHPTANAFFDEVVSELRKVTWPSRQDVVRSTTVVLVCILIASFIIAGFDLLWGKVIGYLLKA